MQHHHGKILSTTQSSVILIQTLLGLKSGEGMKKGVIIEDKFLGHPLRIERKAFRRSLSVVLKPGAPIVVRCGLLTSLRTIRSFLNEKSDWIERNLKKIQALRPAPKMLKEAEEFPFLGRNLRLKVVMTPHRKAFCSRTDENIFLHIPLEEWPRDAGVQAHHYHEHVREFYKREAIRWISNRLRFWIEKTGLIPQKIQFREQKTRWGSCSARGQISLNWRLIVFSAEVIDYVLVHELCHLRHLNHSRQFWSLVESFCPNRRAAEAELKNSQFLPDFLNSPEPCQDYTKLKKIYS
ncbi:MAG: M48 family metallopeptidase [Bdellovibrionaceae bacterium]|nr:M48 family metallopeptidase [Pseudobdellovibrionaceae bacterium]